MSVDPHDAYRIPGHQLMMLVRGLDPRYLRDVQREFATYLSTNRGRLDSWQEGWNSFIGSDGVRQGQVRYTPSVCVTCNGRRFSTRRPDLNMTRTGSPTVCYECRGTGTGHVSVVTKRALPVKAPDVG